MSNDRKRSDLASIEPIAPAPDEEESREQRERVDRVGFAAAASAGTPPAVGVAAEQEDEPATRLDAQDAELQPR